MHRSRLVGFVLCVSLLVAYTPRADAVEPRLAADLAHGDDFRIRVSAALAIGKSGDRSSRGILETALESDPHPAVRASAAAALGALGDPGAIEALRRAKQSDADPAVRSSAKVALAKVGHVEAATVKAKVLVKLGKMTNRTTVRGGDLASILGGATRERASRLAGVEVLGDDVDPRVAATERRLPVLVIDGAISKLSHAATGASLLMSAKVEYVIKREASLKASVTGAAQAEGTTDSMKDEKRMNALQEAALAGAVESALRAPEALLAAAK